MKQKTWFITGCSTGFGRILSEQLLARGDRVIATARNPAGIEGLRAHAKTQDQLLSYKLDVTDFSEIRKVASDAIEKAGRIDVLVNNAGYGYVGALEEVSLPEIRAVYETNVFGLIEMTRAILPVFRAQKSGHIINLSSVAGMVGTPGASIYNSTKFAIEGLSEALAGELSSFGIKVTLIEPGAFRTDFANRSLRVAPYLPEYAEALSQTRKYYETIGGQQPGDPLQAVRAMIALVDHPNPPLRLPMGKIALQRIRNKIAQYESEISTWEKTILETDFPEFR
ncbi:MAG: SDR family NAD(P)-dependent oxidoreductase [Bdellovibrionales bacterium]|nr:SDR family NAD(P)-dependent oxidoreductase [Bdellovibrionales bacterium]